MITEEIKKKLYLYGLIIAAVLGLIFMIFAVFINHGKLVISGEPPFNVKIGEIKNLNCTDNNCVTNLAPGNYNLTIKKDGYRVLIKQVNIPIGGETTVQADFEFIAYISQLDPAEALKIFAQPKISDQDSASLPQKNIFYDSAGIVYISTNPQNGLSTLYTRSFLDGILGQENVISTFQRELKSYNLIPDLANQRVAMIDYTSGESNLYLIDLKAKSRTSLLTMSFIKNIKWLPQTEDYIIEGRSDSDLETSLYLYRAKTESIKKLEVNTPIEDIVPLSKDRLIAATSQAVQAGDSVENLEGKLVVLGENSATPDSNLISGGAVGADQTQQQNDQRVNFIDFSLTAMQGRLLKTTTEIPLPIKLKASQDNSSIYFIAGQSAYELHLGK